MFEVPWKRERANQRTRGSQRQFVAAERRRTEIEAANGIKILVSD